MTDSRFIASTPAKKPKPSKGWVCGFCSGRASDDESHIRCHGGNDANPSKTWVPCVCASPVHDSEAGVLMTPAPASVQTPAGQVAPSESADLAPAQDVELSAPGPLVSKLTVYADLEQRSPEWYAARCGIVTASTVGGLITVAAPDALAVDCPTCQATPGEQCISAARKTPTPIKTPHDERSVKASGLPPIYEPANNETSRGLVALLASERITNHVEETFTNHDMWRGIEAEPFARDIYGEHYMPARECGFMVRNFGAFRIGYSPDGLVGDDGLIEIKAPRQKTHLLNVVNGEVPAHYMAQLQAGLLVSGREWVDFVSYCGGMALWPKRVTPDPAWQAAILATVEQAEKATAETVATYQKAVEGLPVTERIDWEVVI